MSVFGVFICEPSWLAACGHKACVLVASLLVTIKNFTLFFSLHRAMRQTILTLINELARSFDQLVSSYKEASKRTNDLSDTNKRTRLRLVNKMI